MKNYLIKFVKQKKALLILHIVIMIMELLLKKMEYYIVNGYQVLKKFI